MRAKSCVFIILILAAFSNSSTGQFFSIGQSPASIRWHQLETADFKFIYPAHLDSFALATAEYFQLNASAVSSDLKVKPRRTPVLLHTRSAISNAYAIWAPQRIETFTTAPQGNYAQPWMHQLGLHEYRHIVQLSKLNQGFGKALGIVFGQQSNAILTGLFIPPWFLEGDAVLTETLLSNSGRGRVPAFSAGFKAQLTELGTYSFAKATLGSYKNYVPDIYTTGYHIVLHGRQKYGPELWNSALDQVARKPFTLVPFNRGLRKVSGLNKESLYQEAVGEIIKNQKKDFTKADLWNVPFVKKDFAEYLHPFQVNDTVVIALKTSFSRAPEIVKIDSSGRETTIYSPGYVMDQLVSMNQGIMAWSEYRPHIRWQNVSYTDIILFDPVKEKVQKKTFKRRLFAPVAGPDAGSFAAVGYDNNASAYIFISKTDSIIEIPVPAGKHPITPGWTADGKGLIMIMTDESGKSIFKLDIDYRTFRRLTAASYAEISDLFVSGDNIFFTGVSQGTSQICKLNLKQRETVVLTDSRYGALNPSVSDDFLIYNEYTSEGLRIASIKIAEAKTSPYSPPAAEEWPGISDILSKEVTDYQINKSKNTPEPEKYHKVPNLFKIHSWAPLYIDIGGETARPGFSVMSQNLLSTMFITGGYDYDLTEQTGKIRADVSWKGWFPEFRAGFSDGRRSAYYTNSDRRYFWNERTYDFSISQSLNLSSGRYNRGLYGETAYNLLKASSNLKSPHNFREGSISAFTHRLFFYAYERQAYRDLAPSRGINADIRFRHTLGGTIDAGNILGVQSNLFLPGLYRNQAMIFYFGYQLASAGDYRFQNIISTSRGYFNLPKGNEIYSFKASYRMPLAYPDYNLLKSYYIKRIRTNLFYDSSLFTNGIPDTTYSSAGADLLADIHAFGLSTPISIGLRTTYLVQTQSTAFEFLFSINFYEY